MTKRQLIDEIRGHNPSATSEFLAQFDDAALQQYLEHLEAAKAHQIRIAGWARKPQGKLRMVS